MQGLFVEGARWNRDSMAIDEALPGKLYDSLPVILLQPCKRREMQKQNEDEIMYDAPVYKTASRQSVTTKSGHPSNFVTFFPMRSQKPSEHWIFRGVALLCQLND